MQPDPGVPLVHSYDTERRVVRCGARENVRSTKHRSGVTCPTCLDLLAQAHAQGPVADRTAGSA